ncbi:TAXI family TRAP transporter solute-binding subunit [Telmatospirillum sp. J64-1]|uniref:TAXI family TRAP transporter solute-binding subunit n=1 Tax=Telmatospirillum sp. J64-1 TaxID=2502183 RepID=UPI00115F2E59|nr:TAXI family TRAP transporter solute-binding subunit [Telmatospirillum sp. J64-1]
MTKSKWVLAAALVAATFTAPAQAQERPRSLTIATASAGGVYAVYGEGMASLISDVVGIATSTRQTQGPNQNLVLMQTGQVQLGMVTTGPAFEAWTGDLELNPGVEHRNVRALFTMYPTPFQMITLKGTGIQSMNDFQGKRIGAGPRAGTGGTYWPRWINDLGISANYQYGPIGDQASQLADGRLDAIVTAGGIPHPSFSELETTQDVTILGLSDADIQGIAAKNPYAVEFTIPQDTYRSLQGDLKSVAMWNVMASSKDLPEEVAYEIVKAVFENHDRLVKTHASARDTVPENIVHNTVLPLHPGAVRYYREAGIEIPEGLLPPEMKE